MTNQLHKHTQADRQTDRQTDTHTHTHTFLHLEAAQKCMDCSPPTIADKLITPTISAQNGVFCSIEATTATHPTPSAQRATSSQKKKKPEVFLANPKMFDCSSKASMLKLCHTLC